MRNISNLQLKPSISRAFRLNSSFTQEPASTRNAAKCLVEISHHNLLLAMLLKFKELFDGMLGDWKLPPVSGHTLSQRYTRLPL
jgi:hypothetical protein